MENSGIAKTHKIHNLHLEGRRKLDITGVNKVVTFNATLVVLHTTLGILNLKGKDMKVNRLNVENGEMSIEGELVSIVYSTSEDTAGNKRGLLEKLLK